MTEEEIKNLVTDKLTLFAYKLGDYQNACIQAGVCAATGDADTRVGQRINNIQEELLKMVGSFAMEMVQLAKKKE